MLWMPRQLCTARIQVFYKFSPTEGKHKQNSSKNTKDLATYYSYGDFLLGKLMDLFPLSEVLDCLMPLLLFFSHFVSSYPV